MKVVIIEDEHKSLQMMKQMLELFCPDVQVAGTADTVAEGVALIKDVRPDIILLDVELQSERGPAILLQIGHHDFEVIFTTAHKDYAIDAIKHGALDYLLKPIDIEELKQAINKAVNKRNSKDENLALKKFLSNIRLAPAAKLSIYTNEGIVYTDVAQVLRCEAKGPYTHIFTCDGRKYTTSKHLKEYELSLTPHNFFRIHNSHVINLAEVRRYIRAAGGAVEMNDGSVLPISQNHKDEFFERMKIIM